MKTKLFLLVLVVAFNTCYSQTVEHLLFKGVPIDGTLKEYVGKMKAIGFADMGTTDGVAILQGDFAGYTNCKIGVTSLKSKDLVYRIVVMFPHRNTWSVLSGNYFELKDMLTEKYGDSSNVVEMFDVEKYSQPKDDGDKILEVKMDNCKYYSNWKTDKGDLQLKITHDGVSNCYVTLSYFDKINGEVMKAKAKRDL